MNVQAPALAGLLGVSESSVVEMRKRSVALFNLGQHEACRVLCEIVEALGDESPEVQLLLAACARSLGDDEEAKRRLDVGLARAEGDADLLGVARSWGRSIDRGPRP